jgi:hypothetical protein
VQKTGINFDLMICRETVGGGLKYYGIGGRRNGRSQEKKVSDMATVTAHPKKIDRWRFNNENGLLLKQIRALFLMKDGNTLVAENMIPFEEINQKIWTIG